MPSALSGPGYDVIFRIGRRIVGSFWLGYLSFRVRLKDVEKCVELVKEERTGM
jgi:hypothetical protein